MITSGTFSLVGMQDAVLVESCYKSTQNNIAPTRPTSADEDNAVPGGWSASLVSVSATHPYVWESQRKKEGIRWSAWTDPVLKNSWGRQGAKMRMREWAIDTEYAAGMDGEEFYDIVIFGGKLYVCVKTHVSELGVNDPISQGYGGFWEDAQEWAFVATQLLIAGKLVSGKITADVIDADGIKAKNVDIQGTIKAESGRIGSWYINGGNLQNDLYKDFTTWIDPDDPGNFTISGGSGGKLKPNGGLVLCPSLGGVLSAESAHTLAAMIKAERDGQWICGMYLEAKNTDTGTWGQNSYVCALTIRSTNMHHNPDKVPLAINVLQGHSAFTGISTYIYWADGVANITGEVSAIEINTNVELRVGKGVKPGHVLRVINTTDKTLNITGRIVGESVCKQIRKQCCKTLIYSGGNFRPETDASVV